MHHRPSTGKRVRQKGFTRLVGDETAEGCDMRWEAYKQCWSNTDAHISRVLARVGTFQFANQVTSTEPSALKPWVHWIEQLYSPTLMTMPPSTVHT
jgi:hypothetical protein